MHPRTRKLTYLTKLFPLLKRKVIYLETDFIKIRAFGPYIEEQTIDFNELSKVGLFLICGETGSGKTVILDAMTYALYGKAAAAVVGI